MYEQENMHHKIEVNQLLDKLPKNQAELIKMHFFEGYTYEELGKIKGVTKMSISYQVNDILVKMKKAA